MDLAEVCRRLHEFRAEHTIYARQLWAPSIEAIVASEPEDGGLPAAAAERGLTYFIEVGIAREFISDWLATLKAPASEMETCQRLIMYAKDDA